MPLALQIEDDIDHVLQGARAGDRALLGDVPHQHDGDAGGLGAQQQPGHRGPDLGDAPGGSGDSGVVDRLHRIDHRQRRPAGLDTGEQGVEVGLGEHGDLGARAAGAHRAHPELGGRLLSGAVQRG